MTADTLNEPPFTYFDVDQRRRLRSVVGTMSRALTTQGRGSLESRLRPPEAWWPSFIAQCLSLTMLDPREWDYQNQVGLLVSSIAGAGLGIVIGYQSGNGWLGTLIWALTSAAILGGAFYFHRALR